MRRRFILIASSLFIAVFLAGSVVVSAAGTETNTYVYNYPVTGFTWIINYKDGTIDNTREYPVYSDEGKAEVNIMDLLDGSSNLVGTCTSTIRYTFDEWRVPSGSFEWLSIFSKVDVIGDSANYDPGYTLLFHRATQVRVKQNGTWSTLPESEWVYQLYDANGNEIDWREEALQVAYPYYFNLNVNRGTLLSGVEQFEIVFASNYMAVSEWASGGMVIQCAPLRVEWSMVQTTDDAILDQIKDLENNLNTVPPDVQDEIDSDRKEFEDFNSEMQDVIGPPPDLEGMFDLPTGLLDTFLVKSVFDFALSYPVISGFFTTSICLSVVFFILRR